MRQHSIDLLPEALRARARARNAKGRNLVYAAVGALVVSSASVHARLIESRAAAQLATLKSQAEQLALNEESALAMQAEMEQLARQVHRYHKVELPINVSRVIAAIVAAMPESATIERIEIDADRFDRSRGADGAQRTSRRLVAEIAGFAKSDREIAAFVQNLDEMEPFDNVSLDFSRQHAVNEVPAREFRLSFLIDFTKSYRVMAPAPGDAEAGEGDHVD